MTQQLSIEEVIAEQRRALLAREGRVLAQLEQLYQTAIAEAERRARALPDPDSPSAELRLSRSAVLITQLDGELDRILSQSVSLLERERRDVIIRAAEDFGELLGALDLRAGIDPQAIERIGGALAPASPLAELLTAANADGAAAARSALFTGVALGDNPRKIASKLADALDITRARAQTIARTETLRAYRGSVRGRMIDSQLFAGYVWISARDRRTCAMCWAMHGRKFPLETEFATHPNCRCSQAPLTGRELVDVGLGPELFSNLPFERQLRTLGPAKMRAYQRGLLSLEQLVGEGRHPKWGGIRWERSLRDIFGRDLSREFYRPPTPPRPAPRPRTATPPPRPIDEALGRG